MGRFWLFAVALVFAGVGAIAALILRPPAPDPNATNPAVGATVAVEPAATIAPLSGTPVVAQLTSPVHMGDLLDTAANGAIRVQFTDSTFFSLGGNASARIDNFVFDPDRATSRLSLAFLRGAFRLVSGGPLHASAGEPSVQTPVAAIGMRGTAFSGVIGPDAETMFARIDPGFVSDHGDATTATLILLTEGAIDVDGSGVKIAMDVPGQALFFRRKGAAPIGPIDVPPMLRSAILLKSSPPGLGPEPGRRTSEEVVAPPPARPSPSASPTRAAPGVKPTPKPSASPTVRPTPTPSPRVTPKPTPTPSPKATPRPTPTPRFTPRPTPTPRFTPRPMPTPRFTPRPTPTPRFTPKPTPTPRVTPRPTPTPRSTPRPGPTAKPTPRPTPRIPLTNRPRPTPTPAKR